MELCNVILELTDTSALLRTSASPEVLLVASGLEGRRRWSPSGLHFEPTGHNLARVRALRPEEPEPTPQVEAFEEVREPYVSKTVAFPHQDEAARRMTDLFALFMDMGTGKTKVAIDRAGRLWAAGRIDAVLVVSKKGPHRQWIEEQFPTHFGSDRYDAAFWPVKRLPETLLNKDGRLKVFSINYDGAKAEKGKRAVLDFVLAHRGRVFTILDESQEIKNVASARWKAMSEIKAKAGTEIRALLTGTPIAKDLTDEWAQLKWLDESILGIRYVTTFRARYCQMGGYEGREVVGHKNLDEFRALTAPATFRVTQEDIGLLPPVFDEWTFDLDPRQIAAMRALKTELLAELDSGAEISAANAAVAVSKMQQISNGFVLDEEGRAHLLIEPAKNPRLAAMEEYLDAHDGRKVVIWAKFRQDVALIAERLERIGRTHVEYHGGVSDAARAENVASFLDPRGASIFLGNAQSGGAGLNLQGLCVSDLYYSNGNAAIDRWQSEKRIQRIGSSGLVTHTDLIANRSGDRKILANLKRKKSISDLGIGEYRSLLEALP
jgi:hypothetical protein